jgi:hypothetical protein
MSAALALIPAAKAATGVGRRSLRRARARPFSAAATPPVDGELVLGVFLADELSTCVLRGEVARLTGSREAKILVTWTEENGLAVIAAAPDNQLVTIHASVLPSTLDDVRALHALADRLGEQLRGVVP